MNEFPVFFGYAWKCLGLVVKTLLFFFHPQGFHLTRGPELTPEDAGHREVASVPGIAGGHHVLGVEHLLGQFRHREGAVLLGSLGGQRSESGHEEVQTREGHHVHRQLAKISVQLARETQAGGHSGHCDLVGRGNITLYSRKI